MPLPLSRRFRRLALVLLALAGLTGAATPATAAPSDDPPAYGTTATNRTYLALGDSVPFGFYGNAGDLYQDPDNFVGYPELVAEDFGLRLRNASCPGETTASFIKREAQNNGCTNSLTSPIGYRDQFPLHVDYKGSQLRYALKTLETAPRVRLVTLQLGANDAFICQRTGACATPEALQALVAQVETNLNTILSTLRDEGDYEGRIVVVTYYALNYADPAGVAATQLLNAGIARAAAANRALVADGFHAFEARALQAGGSSTDAGLVRPGDIHPTPEGQRLLATAVEEAVGH